MSEPRSELRLRDLGREAHDLVDLPDLGSLERRGRALRLRRQTSAVVAAVVVAMTFGWLVMDRTPQEPQPAPPPDQPGVQVYPGPQMTTLDAGTYALTPSADGADPTVLVTVPRGWNSWHGPNRFGGHRPGDSNQEALERSTWGVGVLVLKVQAVASEQCQPSIHSPASAMSYQETIEAVSRIPGYRTQVVGEDDRFGHPATHLRLVPNAAQRACDREAVLYRTDANGTIGTRGGLDVWVVDVGGTTLTVVAYARGEVPDRYQDELSVVADSITFVPADDSGSDPT